jgi:phosphotransferase system enzyme I (PtsI)
VEIAIRGIGVSPGIAIGPALTFGVQTLDIPKYEIEDSEAEFQRFEEAVAAARSELRRLHAQTARELGLSHADIFKAHLMLLDDVTFREEVEVRLRTEKVNVEYIVDSWIARQTQALNKVPDPRFRERINDLLDVGNRVLGKLLNTQLDNLGSLDEPSVIVAHDLSPSDTANLDTRNTLGIATDVSGPTSHTAILARALEIPAVVGLRHVGLHVVRGDTIIIDGTNGFVFVRPDASTIEEFTREKKRQDAQRLALLHAEEEAPNQTLDGHPVLLQANIELPVEIQHGIRVKAQGVGLYRTEYLFLNSPVLPTEDQQYEAYVTVAQALPGYPVTLRTLDIGGDKFASHLQIAEEINPQLGWRAIRFCLERPDIFKAQLRAMLRASVVGNVQIMFPLISGLDELREVKLVVEDVKEDLRRRQVPFDEKVKIGSMIEVPSAVIIADRLAEECDFFSIGTNDLIQYSLAVDRVNEKIAHLYEPAHPAVLRMIHQTVQAAKAAGIPCGICGEMAGDPLFTELLIGLGVDSFSMSAVAVPAVRAEVGNTRLDSAREFAAAILQMGAVKDIRQLLKERAERRGTMRRFFKEVDVLPGEERNAKF